MNLAQTYNPFTGKMDPEHWQSPRERPAGHPYDIRSERTHLKKEPKEIRKTVGISIATEFPKLPRTDYQRLYMQQRRAKLRAARGD